MCILIIHCFPGTGYLRAVAYRAKTPYVIDRFQLIGGSVVLSATGPLGRGWNSDEDQRSFGRLVVSEVQPPL